MTARAISPGRLEGLYHAESGLAPEDAAARLARFGPNDIVIASSSTWTDLVRDTARDPMIWFLAGIAVLFAILGDYTEAAILAAALVPLAGMDVYLHRRTQASTQGLVSRLATEAKVVRAGKAFAIPARDVVPGDLVEVTAGESFPADGVVVSGQVLQADESSLTGEAYPVRKQPLQAAGGSRQLLDASHWAFAGTRLLTGTARMRVAYTGGETLYGEIVRSATAGVHAQTPLQKALGRLVTVALIAALAMCAALAAIRLMQGHGFLDAVLSAVTLAVAALPEEFPVVFMFFLGVGVYRLARRQALVRRAVAVENIGRVTCICSDKTGTLTEGRLVLRHPVPAPGVSSEQLVYWTALAARADSGDPLDEALLEAAPQAASARRIASFPFTEGRRREVALVQIEDGSYWAVAKGAPETVFGLCDGLGEARRDWLAHVAAYASQGHKIIACAVRPLESVSPGDAEPGAGYALRGFIAFEDPIREGVQDAMAQCVSAGMRVVMITGDHPSTAEAIAREIGFRGGRPRVISADSWDADANDAPDTLKGVDVIARATPAQKLRAVRALQKAGEIVAVTGDGVNDVPALQIADIGIAMGGRGTQSARETASIVLLDDNFRTIVQAIAEGRQLFANLQLSFAYLLMMHISLVLSAAAVPLIDNPLLYLPVHIVWIELIIHPTALLVFQNLPKSTRLAMARRVRDVRFFSAQSWGVIVVSGLTIAAVISAAFEYALFAEYSVEQARAFALALLIGANMAVTAVLSGAKTWTAKILVVGSGISAIVLIELPPVAKFVHMAPLPMAAWAAAVCGGLLAGCFALALRRTMRGGSSPHTPQP
ncbi:MAG: cation-translocating P-type ATPase [Alphaproteobacteria bacterium]